MPRTRLLAVVALVLAALLGTSTPAAQAGRAAPVKKTDLLTPSEIGRAYPALKGLGSRPWPDREIRVYTGECSTWNPVQASSGLSLLGHNRDISRWYQAELVQFKSKKEAKRVFGTFRAHVRECPAYWAGIDTTTERARMPKVGDQRIGYRTISTPAPEKNQPTFHESTIVIRKGKRVFVMSVRLPAAAKAKKMTKLARVAARRMS